MKTSLARKNARKKLVLLAAFLFVFSATLAFLSTKNQDATEAASTSGFRAGNILSDFVMTDYNSMSQADIQNFLKSKNSCNKSDSVASAGAIRYENVNETRNGVHYNRRYYFYNYKGEIVSGLYHVRDGHFVCLADESFDGESAAFIIWEAAQTYKISPKVLIVLLEKEQGLVTDQYPYHVQYQSATGYGCPDTAACDTKYYGFKNQVGTAAWLFNKIMYENRYNNYPVGNNYVKYNPEASCGGSAVYIENKATGAFYTYTPYQPNAAALSAGYGVGNTCSAYGNRNFYLYYTDWFGDVHATSITDKITSAYNSKSSNGVAFKTLLGSAVGSVASNSATGAYWQAYQNGFIIGSEKTGFFESVGKIREAWQKLGFEGGRLGFPTGTIASNAKTGISWQTYQNGLIVGSEKTGFFESSGKIRAYWQKLGFESGKLGFPIAAVSTNSKGTYWQEYQNGFIVGSDATGYFESMGKIREVWAYFKFEGGKLGFPTGTISSNPVTGISWQTYQNGLIVGSDKTGFFESSGKIREYWQKNGFESGKFGFPTSNIKTNGDVQSQTYQKGTIYYNTKTGATWS